MESDDGVQAPEPAREPERQTGWIVPNWVVRAGSTLTWAAVSVTVWEVGTTLRLAQLATDFAFRAPADLVGRAGHVMGRLGGAPPNLPEEVNRALVLRLYRAALQADLPTARKLFAEDVSWHVPGPEPGAGHYRGIAETVPALGAIWRQMGSVEAVELRDVVASPERGAALLRLSVVRSGRRARRTSSSFRRPPRWRSPGDRTGPARLQMGRCGAPGFRTAGSSTGGWSAASAWRWRQPYANGPLRVASWTAWPRGPHRTPGLSSWWRGRRRPDVASRSSKPCPRPKRLW